MSRSNTNLPLNRSSDHLHLTYCRMIDDGIHHTYIIEPILAFACIFHQPLDGANDLVLMRISGCSCSCMKWINPPGYQTNYQLFISHIQGVSATHPLNISQPNCKPKKATFSPSNRSFYHLHKCLKGTWKCRLNTALPFSIATACWNPSVKGILGISFNPIASLLLGQLQPMDVRMIVTTPNDPNTLSF